MSRGINRGMGRGIGRGATAGMLVVGLLSTTALAAGATPAGGFDGGVPSPMQPDAPAQDGSTDRLDDEPGVRMFSQPGGQTTDAGSDGGSGGEVDGRGELADEHEGSTEPPRPDDPELRNQWYLDEIRIFEAWQITRGDPAISVAIVDTGVATDHADLTDAFLGGPSSSQAGFDHLVGEERVYRGPEYDWHGTAVAGVLAARADDGFGIAGVAPEISMMVMRVYESENGQQGPSSPDDSYRTAITGINDAIERGADVILLPWRGRAPDSALLRAIRRAGAAGIPVVASAGNDGYNLSGNPPQGSWPAMYSEPNLVTVAASNRDGNLFYPPQTWAVGQSNYGVRHVDLAAPGEQIWTTEAGGTHLPYAGTSFAAPQVAGALALAREIAPLATPNELINAMTATVRRTPGLTNLVTSGGVLDVAAFLTAVQRPLCNPETVGPSPFQDVPDTNVHAGNIACVAEYGIARGVDGENYRPGRTVTRGQMATFLARMVEAADRLPSSTSSTFTDIEGHAHERSIEIVASLGIAQGRTTTRFAPDAPVTREQMASFVVRTIEYLTGAQSASNRQWFDDIDGSTHRDNIIIARDLGITSGTANIRQFRPDLSMQRDQMGSFLARTLDAAGRLGASFEPLD